MAPSDSAVDLAFDPERVRASRRARGLRAVRDALRGRDAVAFVHAGDDADCAYVSAAAVVVTPDDAVGLVADDARTDDAEVPPTVAHDESGGFALRTVDDPADAVARVADELTTATTGTVLAPRSIRHDAALFLQRAGFDVASTTAISEARAAKASTERDALRQLGRATAAGVDAAVDRLSGAAVDTEAGALRVDAESTSGGTEGDGVDSDPESDEAESTTEDDEAEPDRLTPARLRRTVAVELARRGVDAADTRVRGVDGRLVPGRPVVIDCRPRGPDGSRLRAAWTAVVDGDGGWERRAHVALRAAHRAGRGRLVAALDDEETTGGVESEVRAELTAYGFEDSRVAVHGVGLSAREAPLGGDSVRKNQALVVAASVTREADGTASAARRTDRVTRVETLLLDEETDSGVDRLVPLPASLSPGR